jgi:branched-chain amino acid transport system substrate-binding protein
MPKPVRGPLLLLALLGVCVLTAVGCGGSSQSDTKTVKIGSIHPLTGSLANDGKQMDTGAQMAAAAINSAGGIKSMGGAKLQIVSADSQGKPDVGQQAAQRMVDQGVSAFLGTYQSSVTANVATVAARSRIPLVIDVGVADSIIQPQNKFTFRIQPNATEMGKAGAQYLKQISDASGQSVHKVAYLHDSSDFGTGVAKGFDPAANAAGMQVAQEISYDPFHTNDFSTQLAQAKASNPDVLVVTGYYGDGLRIAKAAQSAMPNVKAVFGVAQGTYDLDRFPTDAGPASNFYFDSNYHFNAKNPQVQQIRSAFQQQTGQPMPTEAVLSYQGVELIAKALEQTHSSDPKALDEAISKTRIDNSLLTFPGPIQFGPNGENVNARPSVMQVQDGKVLQVLPDQFAQAKPKFPATPWSP